MTGQASGDPGGSHRHSRSRVIPEATVARLAVYLRVLTDRALVPAGGIGSGGIGSGGIVSSAELAAAAGVNPAGLRRDLSFLGSHGVRGVGYDVAKLIDEMRRVLGAHHAFRVALVGVGNLGQALAGYGGFAGRGFDIAGLFDVDPAKIGREVSGLLVRHLSELPAACVDDAITIGLIATPESSAQAAADALVAAGIFSILNFASGVVVVPAGIEVRRVDVALELQMLAFHETSRIAGVASS
jgi:redox-sensing transcriptional repressor